MEQENSSLFTEKEKEKQGLVKMDLEICELYFKAIKRLLSEKDSENHFKNIRRFIQLFSCLNNSEKKGKKSSKKIKAQKQLCELKQTLFYRILYIYWNSTCFSSAVVRHFRKFLVEHSRVLRELLAKKVIRICSLGGGCLSDVLAMVKVLESIVDAEEYLDIRVSVIDIDKRWRNTCITILQSLEHFRNATWKIDFIQADLTKQFSESVQAKIKNADIVSMVMLLSEVKQMKKKRKLFPKVSNLMQRGSIFFFLDYSEPSVTGGFGKDSDKVDKCNLQLYKTSYNLHTLDEAVLERVFRLYYDKFHLSTFCTRISLQARIWWKSLNFQNDPYLQSQIKELAEIEKSLAESKARLRKVRQEIQLLQKSKKESIKYWTILFNNEKKKGWCDKKQIRKIIRPGKDVIDVKLERKTCLLTFITEVIMIKEQELKNFQSYLSMCFQSYFSRNRNYSTVSSDKEVKITQKTYKKHVKKFMIRLNQTYPVYSEDEKKDESGGHVMSPETLFLHR